MNRKHYLPFLALAGAGLLWGLTVPLSKLALTWLGPAWLTVARFALSAPLLAFVGRRSLRQALAPGVVIAGAIGFGGVIVLQNAGVQRTSVSHAAVLLGTVPVLVALVAAALGQGRAHPRAWGGSGVALGGIALVAGTGSSGAVASGDLLVLASAVLSAGFIAVQPRLLEGRAPAAVTAVQFAAGALVAFPIAVALGGAHAAPPSAGSVWAFLALTVAGTLVPFWLFAFGQAKVTPDVAGAFVNLEPVVGAAIGWVGFGDAAGPEQLVGALAVIVGIVLSTAPRLGGHSARPPVRDCEGTPKGPSLGRYRRGRARALCGAGRRDQPCGRPQERTLRGVKRLRAALRSEPLR
jgi:drug/metabolite transporter (DMT)-like permease